VNTTAGLRAAIAAINNAVVADNVIDLAPGIYRTQADGGGAFRIAAGMTIEAAPATPADSVRIDGSGHDSAFDLNAGGSTVRFSRLIIQNSFGASGGGGINAEQGDSVELSDCVVADNTGAFGGISVLNFGPPRGPVTLTLRNCVVSGNRGAGIGVIGVAATLDHCGVSDNDGGGIIAESLNSGSTLTLTDCEVDHNTNRFGGGGGIQLLGASATIVRSSVSGNVAAVGGGIVYADFLSPVAATVAVTDSTISTNAAAGGRFVGQGGGISIGGFPIVGATPSTCALSLTNVTVTGNAAAVSGGGVFVAPGGRFTAQLVNTLVAEDAGGGGPDLAGAFASLGHNLIGALDPATASGLTDGVNGDQVGTPAAPVNPRLGPLQDNGGPTFTHALLPGSPALDAGQAGAVATDQRGVSRPQGRATDVGAFEARPFSLAVVAGDGQRAAINTAFTTPLQVRLLEGGAPLQAAGLAVTFSAPGGGAGAAFTPGPTGTTDAAGQASVTATANGTTGTYAVTVTAAGVATPVTFTLTNASPFGRKSAGTFDPVTATWYLRSANGAGPPDAGQFQYGPVTSIPVSGNWNGGGPDPIGAFDPTTFTWYLRNETSAGPPDAGQFAFGGVGFVPVTGDWNNSGHTGIGAYDPTTATWYLRNEPNAGAPDAGVFQFGVAGGIAVVGDWTGTGHLGIGVFDPATFTWYLRSSASAGAPDVGVFQYGGVGFKAVAGDWTGAGHAGVGVIDLSTGTWYLRTETSAGPPDAGQFAFGGAGWLPVVGTFPPQAQMLLAADGEGPGGDRLGQDQLQAAVVGALARLGAAGIDPDVIQSLGSANFAVADLPPGVLGQTDVGSRRVTLSADAAGHGWFVDATPLRDEEFAPGSPGSPLVALPGSPAQGKMDLLTAVLHEMGHLAGHPDEGAAAGPGDLMAAFLAPGSRDTGALDQVFARGL
jgi:hypothetical protein